MNSPICLFTYNRLAETQKTIKALKANHLASTSELFIFSDGPKNDADESKVAKVRRYLRTIDGFKSITIYESSFNKGLADSIISGVSRIIKDYEKVIVLEDDLITSPNFLNFMNQALDYYEESDNVFSISGYTMDLPSLRDYPFDYYLGYRASSWGWGTWKEQWEKVDWKVSDYSSFKWNFPGQIEFMRGGSDLPIMLWKQMNGKIDSWAIRWCYEQYKKDMFTVYPSNSKVKNIGFGKEATHTDKNRRFDTKLDTGEQTKFKFDSDPDIDLVLAKEIRNKFSTRTRLIEKFNI